MRGWTDAADDPGDSTEEETDMRKRNWQHMLYTAAALAWWPLPLGRGTSRNGRETIMIKRIALMFAATTALMLTVVAGFKP
jgi:hypothetical protein